MSPNALLSATLVSLIEAGWFFAEKQMSKPANTFVILENPGRHSSVTPDLSSNEITAIP